MMRWVLALAALLMIAPRALAAETGFLDRTVRVDGKDYAFQVYVPRKPIAGPKPIILALHGVGERGSDGIFQTQVGFASALRRHPERWPAIVVFPQAPLGQIWSGAATKAAMTALAQEEREFHTDRDRVYLAGLSMGGNGTWRLAYENPGRFAAIVPVCGFAGPFMGLSAIASGPDPYAALAQRISRLPVWIIHGGADPLVPVDESRKMFAALQAAGAPVTYKELPGVDHNSWDPGFDDAALPAWLFQQRRKPAAEATPPAVRR